MQHPKYEVWPYKKVLPEHIQPLIDRYKGGESARKICLDFPFSEDVALKVLRDFDVPIKTRKENRFSMGFTINLNAFKDTEEPEAVYFYGWLLTDGCLRETKYGHSVSIQLKKSDIKILESLEKYLGLENRIKTRDRFDSRTNKTYSSCEIQFQYEPITKRLIELGLSPRKSLKEDCPKEFLFNRDFWRGALEGDGYISRPDQDLKLQMCGSEILCNQWKDYCESLVPDMKVRVSELRDGLFYSYSGRSAQCKIILDSLYLGVPEHLRLERKYNLYSERYYHGIESRRTS